MQFLKRSGEDDIALVILLALSILRPILIQKISLNKLITQIESIELSISKQVSNAEVSWLASIIDILLENLRLSRLIICIDRDWAKSIAFSQDKRFMFCFICQKISNLLWKKKKIKFLFFNFPKPFVLRVFSYWHKICLVYSKISLQKSPLSLDFSSCFAINKEVDFCEKIKGKSGEGQLF